VRSLLLALAIAIAAALLVAPSAAIAQGDRSTDGSPRSRVVVGTSFGAVINDGPLSTPRGGGNFGGTAVNFGLTVGDELRISPRWWLAGSLALSQWTAGAGVDAGYQYRRFGLGVAPRLELYRWPRRLVTMDLHLALPIGLSRPSVDAPQRRAFSEHVDSQWGWYAGGTLGVTVLFRLGREPSHRSVGFRVEGGYCRHSSRRRTTLIPVDAAEAPVVEDANVVDGELLFTGAGVLSF
jgi:hypothetical protein